MGVQSVAAGGHLVGKAFWEGLEDFGVLGVDGPDDWSFAEKFDVIEGVDVVLSENDGNDFMSLADANEWPSFVLDIFHEFRILEYPFGGHIIWMLFAFWSNQLKSSTCKENHINLRKKLSQLLLWNIVRNSDRPTPCPSNKVIINFKYVGLIIEPSSVGFAHRLRENSNDWLVTNTPIAMGLIVIAFVVSFPFVVNLVECQFSFEALRRSGEFLVAS